MSARLSSGRWRSGTSIWAVIVVLVPAVVGLNVTPSVGLKLVASVQFWVRVIEADGVASAPPDHGVITEEPP